MNENPPGVAVEAGSCCSQAGSEFNTPRSENNNNFSKDAQEKAATRRGLRGVLQLSVSFPYSQRIQPEIRWWYVVVEYLGTGAGMNFARPREPRSSGLAADVKSGGVTLLCSAAHQRVFRS
jgi:hypothetical protein